MRFDRAALAANIRARRAALDMTQQELADRIGVNITSVVNYESDEGFTPGGDKLWALCQALETDPTTLMGFGMGGESDG